MYTNQAEIWRERRHRGSTPARQLDRSWLVGVQEPPKQQNLVKMAVFVGISSHGATVRVKFGMADTTTRTLSHAKF